MKVLLTIFCLLVTANAFASPAVSYSCIGKNKATNETVVFSVMFSDWAMKESYTNESITIEKVAGQTLDEATAVTYQMHGANKKNDCKKNSQGEINMASDFFMEPLSNSTADWTVTVKTSCKQQPLDLKGYCFND
jgi:hypothetical protein